MSVTFTLRLLLLAVAIALFAISAFWRPSRCDLWKLGTAFLAAGLLLA